MYPAKRRAVDRRRHPSNGGYARGEETRTQIIASALQVFADEGYRQASTRRIAADAGVNPPALQYYFGGKDGLHQACAQQIIDQAAQVLAAPLAAARGALDAADRDAAIEALELLCTTLIDGMTEMARVRGWYRFIARARADGAGPAVSMIRAQLSLPLTDVSAELIGLISGKRADEELTRLRACALLGWVGSLCTKQEHTLAAMHWSEFTSARLELIKSVVREQLRSVLAGLQR